MTISRIQFPQNCQKGAAQIQITQEGCKSENHNFHNPILQSI